jgi:hypothetical protein
MMAVAGRTFAIPQYGVGIGMVSLWKSESAELA